MLGLRSWLPAIHLGKPMPQDPTHIGRYQVKSLLGRGGMGAVYLAEDPNLKRQVVIKIVHEGGRHYAHAMERFQREAEISARLNHPNIITVHDVGEDSDHGPFIAMEYVKGTSLARLIHESGFPVETLLHVLTQTSRGLMAASNAGIVHRDVKPENILVGSDGRVKLTDFGVARTHDSRQLTTVGGIIGTPSYFAPELLQDAEASPATDCYALAVTAFEGVTGTLPFLGDSVASTLLRIVNEPPIIPPGMSLKMRTVFLKAFAKKPRARFPDAYSLMRALVDATSVSDGLKAKLHASMDGTEDSLPGLNPTFPTPHAPLAAPSAPMAAPLATLAPPVPPLPPPTSVPEAMLPLAAPPPTPPTFHPEANLPYPAGPANVPSLPSIPSSSSPLMGRSSGGSKSIPLPQSGSRAFGLLFAGISGLVVTGLGFLGWRWMQARPRGEPNSDVFVSAAAGGTSAPAPTSGPPSAASSHPLPALTAGAAIRPQTASVPADPNTSKPDLKQLQQQLLELKQRNALESQKLQLAQKGTKAIPALPDERFQSEPVKPVPHESNIPQPAHPTAPTQVPSHLLMPESLPTVLPRVVAQAAPNFPRRAREMHFEMNKDHVVRLKVTVDELGKVAAVSVTQGVPGVFGFNEEAIAAAKRSSYSPATKGGKPTRESVELTYVFKPSN